MLGHPEGTAQARRLRVASYPLTATCIWLNPTPFFPYIPTGRRRSDTTPVEQEAPQDKAPSPGRNWALHVDLLQDLQSASYEGGTTTCAPREGNRSLFHGARWLNSLRYELGSSTSGDPAPLGAVVQKR